uniref:hypothetical protein n=1 Tax=Pseudonocardia nigra TaxID=1921578 RepID=UPI001C5D557E
PSRALLDPAAYLDAPKNSRRANEEKINYNNRGLTGPAPSGMTTDTEPSAPEAERPTGDHAMSPHR